MMVVTEKVAEKLKEELVSTCFELGAEFLAVFSGEKDREDDITRQIVARCYEYGVGFRVLGGTDDGGRTLFNIKIDNKNAGDDVINAGGVKIFLDPASAVHLKDYELDLTDGGFSLHERQPVFR